MATIRKRGHRYQAQIRYKGFSTTQSFQSKSDALQWARKTEADIDREVYIRPTKDSQILLDSLFDRFETSVVQHYRSKTKVISHIRTIRKFLGKTKVVNISGYTLAKYRDMRLETVGNETVRHEVSIILRALKKAHIEWNCPLPYGLPKVQLPKPSHGRERRLKTGEEESILNQLRLSPITRDIVIFALETAMRRSEIASIQWEDIDLKSNTLVIPITKTNIPRTIPLSCKAITILKNLPRSLSGKVFNVRADSITQAFDRACKRSSIENLRFHDLRHEATSRLFEKGLSLMEVATITGHRDLKMLRRYTHLKAEDLARKLI